MEKLKGSKVLYTSGIDNSARFINIFLADPTTSNPWRDRLLSEHDRSALILNIRRANKDLPNELLQT